MDHRGQKPDNGNGNGTRNGLSAFVRSIPWSVVIPFVLGWIGFAVTFYTTTNAQLTEHQKQIIALQQTRERLVDVYNARLERVAEELRAFMTRVDRLETPLGKKVEGMQKVIEVLNERVNANATQLNTSQVTDTTRFEQLQRQIDAQSKRDDQLLQALDAQYNALNEHLRSHGGVGVPRR